MDLTNAPGKRVLPNCELYLALRARIRRSLTSQLRALKEFLNWSFEEGQTVAVTMGFAPLPGLTAAKARAAVNALR